MSAPKPNWESVPIPRVAGISRETFEREYYARERPVIIAGNMQSWRAMQEWSPKDLQRIFGSSVLHASLDLPTERAPGQTICNKSGPAGERVS